MNIFELWPAVVVLFNVGLFAVLSHRFAKKFVPCRGVNSINFLIAQKVHEAFPVITLLPGEYVVTEPVLMRSGLTLRGSSMRRSNA